MRSRLHIIFGLLMLFSFLMPVAASAQGNSDAAHLCQEFDASGVLEELDITRGDCVNISHGRASDQAMNLYAGACGWELNQEAMGASNRGQCIVAITQPGSESR